MSKKKTHKNSKDESIDLSFTFKGCKFVVQFEPGTVPEDKQDEIRDVIEALSKEICIDKSYVKCKQNNHKDVFLLLEGWNNLLSLLDETCYGDEADDKQFDMLVEMYYAMTLGYMYNMINDMYPDYVSHTLIENSVHSNMTVDIEEDIAHEWKTYPGKWQTWKKE